MCFLVTFQDVHSLRHWLPCFVARTLNTHALWMRMVQARNGHAGCCPTPRKKKVERDRPRCVTLGTCKSRVTLSILACRFWAWWQRNRQMMRCSRTRGFFIAIDGCQCKRPHDTKNKEGGGRTTWDVTCWTKEERVLHAGRRVCEMMC